MFAMQTNHSHATSDSPEDFWEKKYAAMNKPSSGVPSVVLRNFASTRDPQLALDLGCARGDDAVWLAQQGWQVVGVDISSTALKAARASAQAAGVADRTNFICRDLTSDFPNQVYDLVCALFLHSPMKFDRLHVLRRASESVAPGGLFLVTSHGSRPPWSWAAADTVFPSAEEELAELTLPVDNWRRVFVGPFSRDAKGPDGQSSTVIDNIIALERL